MFSCFRKDVNKNQIETKIQEEYPLERTPYCHPIMKQAVNSKTVYSGYYTMLKLTLAAEGSKKQVKSLEMIRQRLWEYYGRHPELQNQVQNSFPRNTIAVSFALASFQIDKGCSEFKLFPQFKMPEDAYFSYQRLTENVQATYYNEDGIEFLAGICYHPVSPTLIELDLDGINLAILCAINYPLINRKDQQNFTKYKVYGRYCETTGKRVLVSFDNEEETVRHRTYNYITKNSEYTDCQECADEFVSYKFGESVPVDPTSVCPALRLLKPIGIGLEELSRLSCLPINAQISFIRRSYPEDTAKPELRDLLQFAVLNSNWIIDKDFVYQLPIPSERVDFPIDIISVVHKETGAVRHHSESPKVSELACWLDANPDFDVHPSSALIAKFLLRTEHSDKIRGEHIFGLVPPKHTSETSESSNTSQDDLPEKSFEKPTSSDEDSDIEHVEASFGEDFELID